MTEIQACPEGAGILQAPEPTEHPNRNLITSLLKLAAWLESHPVPGLYDEQVFNVNCENKEELIRATKDVGNLTKSVVGDWFSFTKRFGVLRIDWFVRREQICERVPTGKKVVKPIMVQQGEEEEEEFEWRCPPSILSPVCENS